MAEPAQSPPAQSPPVPSPAPAPSFSNGVPAGEQVEIVPCPDGPLLVRGPAVIVGASGPGVERGRRTVALCRCGLSALKPFCDGTHKLTGFRA